MEYAKSLSRDDDDDYDDDVDVKMAVRTARVYVPL